MTWEGLTHTAEGVNSHCRIQNKLQNNLMGTSSLDQAIHTNAVKRKKKTNIKLPYLGYNANFV